MNYRSLAQMQETITRSLPGLPYCDVVVGIPRSGMLAASQIATMLNKPLSTPDLVLEMTAYHSRGKKHMQEYHNILLVDDSVSGGETMERYKSMLHSNLVKCNITTFAVYVKLGARLVDHGLELVPGPRVFQWNWFRSKYLPSAILDMDGVICEDVPKHFTSEEEYHHWARGARPLYLPTKKVRAIATGRREGMRDITAEWLARHNIQYENLFMTPIGGRAWKTKAAAIKSVRPLWMVESSYKQAHYLTHEQDAGIPILCTDSNEMLKGEQNV